jgi:hypothetical protein
MKVIIANPNYIVKVNPPFLSGGGGDGRGITSAEIVDGRLIITFTDGDIEDAGAVTAIVSMAIVGTDLQVEYNNGEIVNLGRVVGQDGATGPQGATGATGPAGPSSLEPFIDAPEELEHFTGYRGGDFSLVFANFTNSGGAITQGTTNNAAFKSISLIRNTIVPSGGSPLTLFRKSSGFLPTYNPAKNDFLFELGFSIAQLPTSGENFVVEISGVNLALNTAFSSAASGIAARVTFDATAGRAIFQLETRLASVSSTAAAATTVAINTAYKMRLRLNQPSGVAQLLVNGTVVATLATNLPTALLMKRILFLKTAGSGTVTADYDYHYDKITFL